MSQSVHTEFDATSTASEVIDGIDLTGRRAVVTGASSGIGVETARALAAAGAEVTLAVRHRRVGLEAAARIGADVGTEPAVAHLDLAEPSSIRTFVDGWQGALHILVDNAGVMALPELQLTAGGWEMQFATNHLGHFALAHGLHGALAAADGARIVSLSSNGHLMSPVVFDDINFARREYDPSKAYGQSKTANALFAVAATARWAHDGITTNAVHPGAIAETNLARHMDPQLLHELRSSGTYVYKTIEQGAATTVLVATSPLLEGVGGRYFEDCHEAAPVDGTADELAALRAGVAPYARDPALADQLWDLSLTTLGD